MRFYNREKELNLLNKADKLKDKHSIFSMIIGRRRVGKTALLLQPFEVDKKDEHLLVDEFMEIIKSEFNEPIFGEIKTFDRLKKIIKRDFSMFKGKKLEKLFIELLQEKQIYTKIGSYWERGNQNEIDIVAIDEIDKKNGYL